MKLLMLTWNYPPTVGGIEQVAYNLAEGLRRLGDEVLVIAAYLNPSGQDVLPEDPRIWRASRPGIPAFLWHALKTGWKLARQEKPDMIICPSLTSAPAAWILSLLMRIPYCVLIHGSDILVPSRFYQMAIRPLLSRAGRLFTNSRHTAALLGKKGYCRDKIRIVCPGVTPPPPGIEQPSPEILRMLEEAKDRPILLTVGRLVKRKGILEFIEQVLPRLAETFPGLLYLVVGSEPKASLIHHERMLDQLNAAISKGGHKDRVHLLGRLSDEDLGAVYRHTSLFVLPCLADPHDVEGFGIVILEAAWHGVPSVATRSGGIPDAIADGKTGVLVEAGHYAALADLIASLLHDQDFRRELGQNARRRAASEFTWDAVAYRYRTEMLLLVAQSE